jgi:hypothetical protein
MRKRGRIKRMLFYLLIFALFFAGAVLVTTMFLKWYYKI